MDSMSAIRTETVPPCPGRTLIIGDVHGCADELEKLLCHFQPGANDRIIAVGDLINRGPDSRRTLQLVRTHAIQTVLGNHEQRLLRAWKDRDPASLKKKDRPTFEALGAADWEWIASWPHMLEIPDLGALVVHAGFDPACPWDHQALETLTHIQVLDPADRPARRVEYPNGRPWADLWSGPSHVFYGHTPRPYPLLHAKATGLDTGCVYGFSLTAVSLPGFVFYKIPAARPYADDA